MNKTDLFYSPRQEVIKAIAFPNGEPEMTEFESAFLCGLIKERKPKKIVEVGIAGGGTTSILLECLSLLDMKENTTLYSVDLSESFYRGNGEKSGYLADKYKDKTKWQGNHLVLLGKYLPEVLKEIGNEIDFVILDTVHALPGEILDFIAVYPYLSQFACIILHDIANNHYGQSTQAFATQILLDTVVAEKIIPYDRSRDCGYPNIGAFVVNNDTDKYLADVFNSLMITWDCFPSIEEYEIYSSFVGKHYNNEYSLLFDKIYHIQTKTRDKHQTEDSIQHSVPEWRKSNSYKIGRMITYIPRKIKQLCNL